MTSRGGIYGAVVVANDDPTFRLSLRIPSLFANTVVAGVKPVMPITDYSVAPPIGSTVYVAFQQGNESFPMWFGPSSGPPAI